MKKFYSLLLLSCFMLLGAQNVMADNITKGGTLYVRNIKAASLGGAVWTSTDGYMRAVVRGGEGNSDTWITPTLFMELIVPKVLFMRLRFQLLQMLGRPFL